MVDDGSIAEVRYKGVERANTGSRAGGRIATLPVIKPERGVDTILRWDGDSNCPKYINLARIDRFLFCDQSDTV